MTNKIEHLDLVSEVREFISSTMMIGLSSQSIEPDESLLQRGILDSTGVLELVDFLQARFGIAIEDEEITPDNMDSLDSIASYLARKGVTA